MKKYVLGAAFLAMVSLSCGAAQAESDLLQSVGLGGPWIVTLTGNIGSAPKWEGSGANILSGFPSISLRRPNEKPVWSSPDDSIGYSIKLNDIVSVGPVIFYRSGRYSGGDRSLAGIHDARWTLEPGIFVQAWAVPDVLRARIEIRRGFRAKDGFVAELGADWLNKFGALTLAVGPRLALGDGSFMRTHFGVTDLDALYNTGVTPYKATAGLRSAGVFASALYTFNPQWSTTVFGGYNRLLGDAAASPIVKSYGERNQWAAGGSLSYSFNFSGF